MEDKYNQVFLLESLLIKYIEFEEHFIVILANITKSSFVFKKKKTFLRMLFAVYDFVVQHIFVRTAAHYRRSSPG